MLHGYVILQAIEVLPAFVQKKRIWFLRIAAELTGEAALFTDRFGDAGEGGFLKRIRLPTVDVERDQHREWLFGILDDMADRCKDGRFWQIRKKDGQNQASKQASGISIS